jgi:hypothetical protein
MAEQHAGQVVPDVLTLSQARLRGPDDAPEGGVAVVEVPPKVSLQMMPEPSTTYVRARRTLAIRHTSGRRIVAMIEIVSPANKDRSATVRDFVHKAVSALQQEIHLLVVDLHPPGSFDPEGMHGAIWDDLYGQLYQVPEDRPLTLAAYAVNGMPRAYVEPIAVGMILPDMPLFLSSDRYVNVPLEATYVQGYRGLSELWREMLEGRSPSGEE